MKATKAYIASLGTTGVLLAASLLMLAVVSAVVAFDRWPGATVTSRVQTLVLNDKPAAIRIGAHAAGPSATPGVRTAIAGARGTAPAQRIAGERLGGVGRTIAPVAAPTTPTVPAAPVLPKAPQVPSPDPIIDTISNPGSTATQIADTGQSVTDAAGVNVGRVSPELGTAVQGVGGTAVGAVRSLPLPGHVLPGH